MSLAHCVTIHLNFSEGAQRTLLPPLPPNHGDSSKLLYHVIPWRFHIERVTTREQHKQNL